MHPSMPEVPYASGKQYHAVLVAAVNCVLQQVGDRHASVTSSSFIYKVDFGPAADPGAAIHALAPGL